MTIHANGMGGATEAAYGALPYAGLERADEFQQAEVWEQHPEAHPYAAQYAAPEWSGEDEIWGELPGVQETYGTSAYANQEWATEGESWEQPESYETYETYGAQGYTGQEFNGEDESYETYEQAGYASHEDESDQFLPLLAPLAAKVLPAVAKFALPAAKKLLPFAKRAVSNVVRNVIGGGATRHRAGGGGGGANATARALVRQLQAVLGEGESEAAALEAQFFGANEFQGELAGNEQAHEAALTEVLAAEAAHTASESEAAAILGATLPITIAIMGGRRALRPVLPALMGANSRLVRGLYRSGPAGPQLTRLVPSIQRRTVASLRAAQRSGQPVTPTLATRVMAGQAARVLGTPRISGPALVRNTAIRSATVAPAGQRPRPGPPAAMR